jgi:error-prone DNA polymerase
VQIGLGYVHGVRAEEVAALVAARREGGPFASLEDLASRAGAGRAALERLAWSGACDELAGTPSGAQAADRRIALWRLGVTVPGHRVGEGTQLALALDLPAAPELERLSPWESMIADYETTGLTAATHPLGLLRERMDSDGAVHVGALAHMDHEAPVRIGGLVVARQRPGTAKGVTFLLLEDEHGTVNIVVPPKIYERDRLTVRTEPLVIVEGRLERHPAAGGAINIVARRVTRLDIPDRVAAEVKDFSLLDALELGRQAEQQAAAALATGTDDFRAVAPAVMSFAQGRRR